MSARIPPTAEIVALRKLGRSVDGRWVDWAVDLLVEGHDSPALAVLAGESAPFNQFEMAALVDRVLDELRIDLPESREAAVRALTTVRVRQLLEGDAPVADVLSELAQLCIENDYASEIYDFYLLHFAREDLESASVQYYWPGATRRTILRVIEDRCRQWIRDYAGDG